MTVAWVSSEGREEGNEWKVGAPIFDSLEMSLRSETPVISDPRIRGTAISFRALIKMVPKGLTQSWTTSFPQEKLTMSNPKSTPSTIPIKIFQCKARFFMP